MFFKLSTHPNSKSKTKRTYKEVIAEKKNGGRWLRFQLFLGNETDIIKICGGLHNAIG